MGNATNDPLILSTPVKCRKKGFELQAVRVPEFTLNPNDSRFGIPKIEGEDWLWAFIEAGTDYQHIGLDYVTGEEEEGEPIGLALYNGERLICSIEAGDILIYDPDIDEDSLPLQCITEDMFNAQYEIEPPKDPMMGINKTTLSRELEFVQKYGCVGEVVRKPTENTPIDFLTVDLGEMEQRTLASLTDADNPTDSEPPK